MRVFEPSYSHINNTCYSVHLTVSGFIESPLENAKINRNQGDVCVGRNEEMCSLQEYSVFIVNLRMIVPNIFLDTL